MGTYVVPFFILIAIGVIIVLLFKLWGAIFAEEEVQGAYIHVVDGSVQVKQWKAENYISLAVDTLFLEGDELRVPVGSRAIVEFFDGTLMRLEGGSDVIFQEMNSETKIPSITILLVDGETWFNKIYKDSNSEFTIKMNNIDVKSNSTDVFALSNEFEEAVRGINGSVEVNVYSKDDDNIVESENVGVGQEIVFTDAVLKKYWEFQSPNVLFAIADNFRESEWYKWNISEDESPSAFVKVVGGESEFVEVEPEIFEPEVGDVDGENGEESTEDESTATEEESTEPEEAEDVSVQLSRPTITSVAGVTETNADGFYVISNHIGTLTGNVSGASKVTVNNYTLQEFKLGDTTWKYLANANFNLMVPGENTYEVYSEDENGNKSETLIVKVLYNPPPAPVQPPPEETPAEEPTEDTSTDPPDIPEPDWF